MIPLLPKNPMTITPRVWPLNTKADYLDRLEHLRRLDTHQRATDAIREQEKVKLENELGQLA